MACILSILLCVTEAQVFSTTASQSSIWTIYLFVNKCHHTLCIVSSPENSWMQSFLVTGHIGCRPCSSWPLMIRVRQLIWRSPKIYFSVVSARNERFPHTSNLKESIIKVPRAHNCCNSVLINASTKTQSSNQLHVDRLILFEPQNYLTHG